MLWINSPFHIRSSRAEFADKRHAATHSFHNDVLASRFYQLIQLSKIAAPFTGTPHSRRDVQTSSRQ
jgi:hypothetical protein